MQLRGSQGTYGVAIGQKIDHVDGVKREVSLLMIDNPEIGDYVIVHAGFALHKIDETVAMESLQILRDTLEIVEQDD